MDPANRKRKRGCGVFLAALVLGLLVALGIGMFAVHRTVMNLTDPAPAALPKPELSDLKLADLRQKIRAFQQAIRQQRPTAPLSLTPEEINALIETTSAAETIRGKVHFLIRSNQPYGRISIRLGELGFPLYRERFLNGTASFSLELTNGMLYVKAEDFKVRGRSLPPVYLNRIRSVNLAHDVNEDPRGSMALERLERIEFRDDKLVIVPRQDY